MCVSMGNHRKGKARQEELDGVPEAETALDGTCTPISTRQSGVVLCS